MYTIGHNISMEGMIGFMCDRTKGRNTLSQKQGMQLKGVEGIRY